MSNINSVTEKPKYSRSRSFAFKKQQAEGAALANLLPTVTPMREAVKLLGVSDTMIRRSECAALSKVAGLLRAQLAADELGESGAIADARGECVENAETNPLEEWVKANHPTPEQYLRYICEMAEEPMPERREVPSVETAENLE